jgi:hypothetical protein
MKKCAQKPNPELPHGYAEAYEAFHGDSVEHIWSDLNLWRAYEKGFVDVVWPEWTSDDSAPVVQQQIMERTKKTITQFQARILKAILEGNKFFLAKLYKAVNANNFPEPEMYGAYVAIHAFNELFLCEGHVSRAEWPTKQEVRIEAEKILSKNGISLTDRQWPRIYKTAGLSELDSATKGSARKRKTPSGN